MNATKCVSKLQAAKQQHVSAHMCCARHHGELTYAEANMTTAAGSSSSRQQAATGIATPDPFTQQAGFTQLALE